MMSDIAAARDAARQFIAGLPEIGGTLQKELYAPLSTTDYGGSIAQLLQKPADSLVMYVPGTAGINLAKQQAQFGLFGKYKLVLSASMVNEVSSPGRPTPRSASGHRRATTPACRASRTRTSSPPSRSGSARSRVIWPPTPTWPSSS
jgi:hypothetical protein